MDTNNVENVSGMNEQNQPQENIPATTAKKQNVIVRFVKGVGNVVMSAVRSRTGKTIITISGLGLSAYEGYKYGFRNGQKSATTTAVTITAGEEDEDPETEEPAPAEEAKETEQTND